MREMVGGCCVCSDDRGWSENPLVYCDGQSCTVAVHQACYGIVTVPTGPWYCRKCESQERSVKVKCELCPSKYGALKRTDNQGWAHVVCALYIPEVRFGNVTTMEPIQLQLIPTERFNKVCYICEEKGKPANAAVGACMQCNKAGCRQQFHVTCAQGLGLLCEEAGNYLDNVKYCGYCQHHYSKLKKGGNVKTIPPYKPEAHEAHNSDSSSEKEGTAPKTIISPPTAASKKRPNAGAKAAGKPGVGVPSKAAKGAEKARAGGNAKGGKVEQEAERREGETESKEGKDGKGAKKRKANSRTPTPVGVVGSEVSVVVNPVSSASAAGGDKGGVVGGESTVDKKKAKIEATQSIITNQPVVALTSISTAKPTAATPEPAPVTSTPAAPPANVQAAQSHSLVVSVPLATASLSPLGPILCNQTSVVTATPAATPAPERGEEGVEKSASVIGDEAMTGGNSNQEILSSVLSPGGLKITYEKQMDSINTEVDMELELEPSQSTVDDEPVQRGRSQSQSNEKTDRSSRSRKRNSGSATSAPSSIVEVHQKRSSRSQHVTPPPQPHAEPPGAFAAISQSQMKESPPSSPNSESQSNLPSTSTGSRGRRGRKSAPASVKVGSGSSKDSKDVKMFQNGISAPHMLGNQLNPNSTMHSKMSDHLNNEIEAHSIFTPNELGTSMMGPQLHHKVLQQARAGSTSSSTASGGTGLSSMLGGGGGTIPQTLDQLLERQWEQGSQFLMEQAQHFDIASLLSCLHQLRAENTRLEEHVSSLLQRRDHLLAVNARLAIPLTNQPAAAPVSTHPHQINNIHPSVAASHADVTRSARLNGANSVYPSHPQGSAQHPPVENGLPPDAYGQNPHRSPAGSQQSPNMRW